MYKEWLSLWFPPSTTRAGTKAGPFHHVAPTWRADCCQVSPSIWITKWTWIYPPDIHILDILGYISSILREMWCILSLHLPSASPPPFTSNNRGWQVLGCQSRLVMFFSVHIAHRYMGDLVLQIRCVFQYRQPPRKASACCIRTDEDFVYLLSCCRKSSHRNWTAEQSGDEV
jgi:hypothetical protein